MARLGPKHLTASLLLMLMAGGACAEVHRSVGHDLAQAGGRMDAGGEACDADTCAGGTAGAGGIEGASGSAGTTGTEGKSGAAGADSTASAGGTAAAGEGASGNAGSDAGKPGFILGADISWVQEREDQGVRFTDNGVQKDILQILKDHGFNYIRLRLFHDPGSPNGYQYEFVTRAEPYCDLDHTVQMAQRVKAAGMAFFLDYHLSDTWADPDDQHKPAAWEGLSFEELVTAVYDYTRETLLTLQAADALPDMVQIGNEITPGMLFPDGAIYNPDNWDQLAELLTAGLSAVKEVNTDIQTVLHLDRGGDNLTSRWWIDEALSRGVQFDILGQSCFSLWQGTPDGWEQNFTDLAERYPDHSFLIAEYADNYRAANDIMFNLPRGLGTFIWEPTAQGEWGPGLFVDGATTDAINLYDEMARDYGLR